MSKNVRDKQNSEDAQYEKKDFIVWLKAHSKQLSLVGVTVTTLVIAVLFARNSDTVKKLRESLREEIDKINMYSTKWFKNATDATLKSEREKVRFEYCSSGSDINKACRLEKLLKVFDNEMNKRAWGDEIPKAPSFQREHGWYLSNDD